MSQLEDTEHTFFAFAQAVFVFAVLFGGLMWLVRHYDFSNIDLGNLAFIIATAFLLLIAREVFNSANDKYKTREVAKKTKIKSDVVMNSSQKLFSEVYDNSLVAYLIVDDKGHIISANTAATRLLGRSSMRLNKASFFSCIDTNKTEHLVLLKEKFRNRVTITNEEIEINRSGDIAWAILSILQLADKNGDKSSLVTLLDVTKQKEIDIAKSEFVSLASHQLRTPIAGMRWSAELLLMDGAESLTKQQKRYVDRLLSNIHRMGNLVDDFLQVSRFDLGTRILQSEVVNIRDLLDDVILEQKVSSDSKKLKIEKMYDSSVNEIVTDENLLRMIVTNLYTNAIKYSRNEGNIDVSYHREIDKLIFEIKDNGMGIPAGEQSRIFTKMFRASNAVGEIPDGNGLGLYIVKKAVQVLEGRVNFISEEDSGTTFSVVIPIAN